MDAAGPDAVSATGAGSEVETFWHAARDRIHLNAAPGYFAPSGRESLTPPAWSFGGSPEQADELLGLVLDGTKTAAASALWEFEADEEEPPSPGDLSIVLDGNGAPRAILETTHVEVRPFDKVDAEHARLEGEGDRSLVYWREAHKHYFTEHATDSHGFSPTMPVVLERFRVLYPA